MPKTKEQKKEIIKAIKEKIDKQAVMIFVGFQGVKAQELFSLRQELKKVNSQLLVIKKTLADLAFKEKNIPVNVKELEGEIGIVFGFDDVVMPAKVLYQISKTTPALKIKAGFLSQGARLLTEEEVVALAKLPSREELLAKVVGSLSSPLVGLVNTLQSPIKGLLLVLSEIKK